MDDRYSRYDPRDDSYNRGDSPEYARDFGSGPDYAYTSARDFAAAGEDMRPRPRARYGPRADYAGNYWNDGHRTVDYRGGGPRRPQRDRDFFERAGDEVRSWFGDEDAERRRELDQREDERRARMASDDHYRSWRRERIAELDRDYDEYRRENAERFHNEFSSWRTDRQGQRDGLSRVTENMEVVGSDGERIGAVDKVRGDRILLNRNDPDSGGHHHSIPSRWIQSVGDTVTLRKTAEQAKAHWKDEERQGALFGDREGEDTTGPHMLNRSFSGTY